jgi:hypothetical protein
MFHAALLHLMLVAVSTQTTFTISLKRNALAAGRPSRPNTPSDEVVEMPAELIVAVVVVAFHCRVLDRATHPLDPAVGEPAQVLIDSSAVKAHRCAAGAKGGHPLRRSTARVAAERQKSML